ncbi:UNVERIFIED_CONTAM: hypothetical protein GTU68_057540 [Idotea baltica]|nr:hypothetical protein [Idotea baltica]
MWIRLTPAPSAPIRAAMTQYWWWWKMYRICGRWSAQPQRGGDTTYSAEPCRRWMALVRKICSLPSWWSGLQCPKSVRLFWLSTQPSMA